ncbi:hypothetical protein BC938DRAFT_482044 [Jimgerdemannia flammicorona]|uniref:Uncharacterized protein n=1 Tax=Jimgerdemannia flammicorona TaxID=994334 RepID=A0A433QEY9_9FUNG|nr:hypothetical protein BC938DRAFT_482044 [Jimgerdemannia flammicorona]
MSIQFVSPIPEPMSPNSTRPNIHRHYSVLVNRIAEPNKIFNSLLYPVYAHAPSNATLVLKAGILDQRKPFRDVVRRGLELMSSARIQLHDADNICKLVCEEGREAVPHRILVTMIQNAFSLQEDFEEIRCEINQIFNALQELEENARYMTPRTKIYAQHKPAGYFMNIANWFCFQYILFKLIRMILFVAELLHISRAKRVSSLDMTLAGPLYDSHLMPLLELLKDLQDWLFEPDISQAIEFYIATLRNLQRSGEGVSARNERPYDEPERLRGEFRGTNNPAKIMAALGKWNEALLQLSLAIGRLL